jgi:benzoate/toluate 1,2-dioxygenase beta subunit
MSTRDNAARAARPAAQLDLAQCEAFLIHEARLLDEAQFDQWLALFTPDARYWVPSTPGQQSTSRIVTNLSLEPGDGAPGTLVRSKFTMVEYRREEQRLFAGTYWHRLVGEAGNIRIAMKRIDLVNCDAPLDGLVVPF